MFSQACVKNSVHRGGVCIKAHTPGQTTPRQTPAGRHPPGQTIPPGRHPPPPLGRHPPGRHPLLAATAADGTHPTGMHSCWFNESDGKHEGLSVEGQPPAFVMYFNLFMKTAPIKMRIAFLICRNTYRPLV